MGETSGVSAALARLEAALARIARAAHRHDARHAGADGQDPAHSGPQRDEAAEAQAQRARAVAERLDQLIVELRGALAPRE